MDIIVEVMLGRSRQGYGDHTDIPDGDSPLGKWGEDIKVY
jgi:hypothetical protein